MDVACCDSLEVRGGDGGAELVGAMSHWQLATPCRSPIEIRPSTPTPTPFPTLALTLTSTPIPTPTPKLPTRTRSLRSGIRTRAPQTPLHGDGGPGSQNPPPPPLQALLFLGEIADFIGVVAAFGASGFVKEQAVTVPRIGDMPLFWGKIARGDV